MGDLLTTNETAVVLSTPAGATENIRKEIERFSKEQNCYSSDEDANSEGSVFETFYQSGELGADLSLTNFSVTEFTKVWNVMGDFICSNWNMGFDKWKRMVSEFPSI